MNGGHRWVLGSWLAMIAFITVRQVQQSKGLPQPGAYLSSAVVFTTLYGLASLAPSLAAVMAMGTAGAALAAPYFSSRPSSGGVINTLTDWLNAIGSGTQQTAPPPSKP